MEKHEGRLPNVLPKGAVEPISEMDLIIAKLENDGCENVNTPVSDPEKNKKRGSIE